MPRNIQQESRRLHEFRCFVGGRRHAFCLDTSWVQKQGTTRKLTAKQNDAGSPGAQSFLLAGLRPAAGAPRPHSL